MIDRDNTSRKVRMDSKRRKSRTRYIGVVNCEKCGLRGTLISVVYLYANHIVKAGEISVIPFYHRVDHKIYDYRLNGIRYRRYSHCWLGRQN